MSRNPVFVDAGRATFQSTCASCHHAALTGGIGPNLVDAEWIHGGTPADVLKTVTEGVLTKGMPGWGPMLGGKKVSEVVAFILSQHDAPAQ
jgi:cytochrome c oxidase cbb3-type subunit 3